MKMAIQTAKNVGNTTYSVQYATKSGGATTSENSRAKSGIRMLNFTIDVPLLWGGRIDAISVLDI
jgi:hypothetical protein